MIKVRALKDEFLIDKGKTYYIGTSDFCGGCWHIFLNKDGSGWLFNIFKEDEYRSLFEECEKVS